MGAADHSFLKTAKHDAGDRLLTFTILSVSVKVKLLLLIRALYQSPLARARN
jgi:hypothetical protein